MRGFLVFLQFLLVSGFALAALRAGEAPLKNVSAVDNLTVSYVRKTAIGEAKSQLKITTEGAFGLWTDHVLPWWEHRNEAHILFLKYEDLKKDLCSNVRRISEFLEKPLSEEMVAKISHQCTFAEMKKNSDSFTMSVYPTKPSLLRKGEVGGWKSHFSEQLNKSFDEKFMDKLDGTGLHFD